MAKAPAIRLRLGATQAVNNLRRLQVHRRELGAAPFTGPLTQVAADTNLTVTITSLVDRVDGADEGTP